ncbi:MAG: glycosyltransferase family 4 protein, partial [bacterium]
AVGRFDDPRKNLDMLVKVFDKLDSIYTNLKLNVVGPKPSDKKIATLQKFKSFKNINFTGLISDEELKNYYQNSRLMLITSYQEGLGIVGLEALSNGIPVVATNCGGVSDFIVNEKNGFLVDVNDVDGMTAKAALILRSEELTTEMSEFAIKFVNQNFSEQKIYSIFKYGLSSVYPELGQWFEKCDEGCFQAAEIDVREDKKEDKVTDEQTDVL